MIGIYKITNKTSGKSYIGQSNDIARRFKEHQRGRIETRIPVDVAINKYGFDAFTYTIIEECSIDQLNTQEEYWIKFYNTKTFGYNCSDGGNQQSIGENNGRAKMTETDIKKVRIAYAQHSTQKEIYEQFKHKISFGTFQQIWQGKTWKHVMPEIYTEENKRYYVYDNSKGVLSNRSEFSAEEIMAMRTRYINESAKEIHEDYKHRIKLQTLQSILWGREYKNLPVYKKREKKWVNP